MQQPTSTLVAPQPSRAGVTPPARRGRSTQRVVDHLVELGFVDAAQAAVPPGSASTPEAALLASGAITEDQLARALAARFGLDHVDLEEFDVDVGAVSLIPADTARRHRVVPIGFLSRRVLYLAMADPADVVALDEIAMMTGHELQPAVASATAVLGVVERFEHLGEGLEAVEEHLDGDDPGVDLADASDAAPVVKLVNSIIAQAAERGASDIHLDPGPSEMRVWLRVDGILSSPTTLPARVVPGVVSRLKIMAGMDIAERRMPQDGRMSVTVAGRTLDLRVLTLPLVRGEGVVIRMLDRGHGLSALDEIGMVARDRARLEDALGRAHGIVLVTGPTGSGKTTTLYASLGVLNTGERSIVSIEDPVEYEIDGVKQIQVNAKTGLTFATGLRSMLRADPDVVMVGEIRDRETAQIAIEAALTGHLVLSTLHTNDAPAAVARLLEMGVEPFLVASAVNCVVAQRLVRTLCEACRAPVELPAEALARPALAPLRGEHVYDAAGCHVCGGSGYRGRTGVYELMPMSDELRELALGRGSAAQIAAVAQEQGMTRLREDGLAKVVAGHTTVAEVARVAGLG